MMHFHPAKTLPALYTLPTGVTCEVHDHDLTPVGFRLFLSALTNALAFTDSRTPDPKVVADYFNRDKSLLSGWFIVRSIDKEISCDVAEYDVGTYIRFCLDHKYLYIAFRRNDPFQPSLQALSDADDDVVSTESHDSHHSLLKLQQQFDDQSSSESPHNVRRRMAMRWTATDLENLRTGVARYGRDWVAIINNFDFRGRNTRALSERWHRLNAAPTKMRSDPSQPGLHAAQTLELNPDRTTNNPISNEIVVEKPKRIMKRMGKRRRAATGLEGESTEAINSKPSRPYTSTTRFYSEQEERNLREGVGRFGQDWVRILAEYWGVPPDRSTKSLAKKWRVLNGLPPYGTGGTEEMSLDNDEAQNEVPSKCNQRPPSPVSGGDPVRTPNSDNTPLSQPKTPTTNVGKRSRRSGP